MLYLLNIILLVLPANLGYHFILSQSYLKGLLIDYLIPTFYLQDFLVISFVILYFYKGGKVLLQTLQRSKLFQLVIFLNFSILLSVLLVSGSLSVISLLYFARFFLYSLFGVCVSTLDFKLLKSSFKYLVVGTIFISVLGSLQFIKQSSVFNNYLFFGEQVYNSSTPGITKESLFGFTRMPSYGLFRHPNTFGGYMAILIVLLAYYLINNWSTISKKNIQKFYLGGLVFMAGVLVLTFSYISMFVLVIGVFSLFMDLKGLKWLFGSVLVLSFLIILSSFFVHQANTSILRRSELNVGGVSMFKKKPLYGWGFGVSTADIEEYTAPVSAVRFVQPAHNIFLLMFVEAGVISGLLFYIIFIEVFTGSNSLGKVLIIMIVLLGTFDHYILTMHQTLLLTWLVLGLSYRQKTPSLNIIK